MTRYLGIIGIAAGAVFSAWVGVVAGRAMERLRVAEANLATVPLAEHVAALEGSSYRCIQIRTDRTDVTIWPSMDKIPVVKLKKEPVAVKGRTP